MRRDSKGERVKDSEGYDGEGVEYDISRNRMLGQIKKILLSIEIKSQ